MRRFSSARTGMTKRSPRMVMRSSLGCAVAGELAKRGTQAFFDRGAAGAPDRGGCESSQFGRGIVGQSAIGLNGALYRLCERTKACGEGRRKESGKAGDFANETRGGRLLPRDCPGGCSSWLAGRRLAARWPQERSGVGLRGQLGGVKEAAEKDGNLLAQKQADLACELMLAADPGFVGGGLEIEDRMPAYRRAAKPIPEPATAPTRASIVGMFNRRRDGIEKGHTQELSCAVRRMLSDEVVDSPVSESRPRAPIFRSKCAMRSRTAYGGTGRSAGPWMPGCGCPAAWLRSRWRWRSVFGSGSGAAVLPPDSGAAPEPDSTPDSEAERTALRGVVVHIPAAAPLKWRRGAVVAGAPALLALGADKLPARRLKFLNLFKR